MGKLRLTYIPLPDATPESELDALAAVYAFILDCHESRKVADSTGDRNEVKEDETLTPPEVYPNKGTYSLTIYDLRSP